MSICTEKDYDVSVVSREIERYIKASQASSTLIVECEKSLFGDRERMKKWLGVGF